MKENVIPIPTDAARSELDAVAASLVRTPRLQRLLRYLVERYFDDEIDQLTEYNIATEVFGRRKTDFIASEDAIARVETHRLRKRLATYYESQGKDHPLQIAIPLGTYVPAFVERKIQDPPFSKTEEPTDLDDPIGRSSLETGSEDPLPERGWPVPALTEPPQTTARRWPWQYAPALLVLAVASLGSFLGLRSWINGRAARAAQNPKQDAAATGPTPAQLPQASRSGLPAPVPVPLRIIAGYEGPPQRDDTGEIWGQDAFFRGGWAHPQTHAFVARTSDPFIFQYGRDGDFSYDIPLAPGLYELHLFFMQGSDTAQAEDAENKSIFSVTINGALTLVTFDIVSDAMGRNVADERVFRDISPGPDGLLHLRLNTVLGTPSISAVAILPGSAHKQNPIRLVMQPTPYTDRNGKVWSPDNYFLNGRYLSHNIPVGSVDTDVLSFERYGHFDYAIPVDPRDRYTVILHFTELYFGSAQANLDDTRVFRVLCNGETLLDDFNIFKEAGTYHMLEKTFYHLKPSAQGKLNIDFEPVSNYATVSSIEVLDESH